MQLRASTACDVRLLLFKQIYIRKLVLSYPLYHYTLGTLELLTPNALWRSGWAWTSGDGATKPATSGLRVLLRVRCKTSLFRFSRVHLLALRIPGEYSEVSVPAHQKLIPVATSFILKYLVG